MRNVGLSLNLRVFAFTLTIASAVAVLLMPVSVGPRFSTVQSLSDLGEPLVSALVFYLFSALTIGSLFLTRKKTILSVIFVGLYAFIFLNFWITKSPVPLYEESAYRIGFVKDVISSGHINLSLGYVEYPAVFAFGSIFTTISGLPLISSIFVLELSRAVIIALLIFVISLRLLNNIFASSVASILAIQDDIMLSRMPAFHPEVFGLIFFLLGILILTQKGDRRPLTVTLMIALAAGSMSYSLSVAFVFVAAAGILIGSRLFKIIKPSLINYKLLALVLIIFLFWNLYVATQILAVVSSSLQIGSLFDISHYYYLSTVANSNTVSTPFWVGTSTYLSVLALFGLPLILVTYDALILPVYSRFVKRSFKIEEILFFSLLLAGIPLLAITGGAEATRLLYYLAPFSSMILIQKVLASKKKNILLFAIIVVLIIGLSFPLFLAYNTQNNFNSNYPQSLDAGSFIQSYDVSHYNAPIFGGGGLSGITGAFYENHPLIPVELNLINSSESYNYALHQLVSQFGSSGGSVLTFSLQDEIGADFIYGQQAVEPILSNFTSSLSKSYSLVYNNGFTVVYYN